MVAFHIISDSIKDNEGKTLLQVNGCLVCCRTVCTI